MTGPLETRLNPGHAPYSQIFKNDCPAAKAAPSEAEPGKNMTYHDMPAQEPARLRAPARRARLRAFRGSVAQLVRAPS